MHQVRTVCCHPCSICRSCCIAHLQTYQMIVAYIYQKVNNNSMFNSIFKKSEKQKQKVVPKQQQNKGYYDQKLVLPPNFAQNVMELQMQLQFIETYNMDLVQQLNQMYRIAIEYYINEDPRKANHFQKKLTSLLTHPYTLELIQKKPNNAKTPQVDTAQYSSHLRMQLNKFNTQSDIVIRSMIEGSNKKVQKSNRLMSDNLSSQEQMLNKRMQQRSRSKKKLQTLNP